MKNKTFISAKTGEKRTVKVVEPIPVHVLCYGIEGGAREILGIYRNESTARMLMQRNVGKLVRSGVSKDSFEKTEFGVRFNVEKDKKGNIKSFEYFEILHMNCK